MTSLNDLVRTDKDGKVVAVMPRTEEAVLHRKQSFLAAYPTHGNIKRTCEALGMTPHAVMKWKREDEVFKEALAMVEADWKQTMVAKALGVVEDHLDKGNLVAADMALKRWGGAEHNPQANVQHQHTAHVFHIAIPEAKRPDELDEGDMTVEAYARMLEEGAS